MTSRKNKDYSRLTFSPHAHFQTFPEAAVLALVSMVLVDWAVSVPPTRVCEISSH